MTCNSNIWSPGRNKEVVKTIASKYKFSTRLQETILGWDSARAMVKQSLQNQSNRIRSTLHPKPLGGDTPSLRSRRAFRRSSDPERGIADLGGTGRAAPTHSREFHQEDIEMYRLLQEQYNYTTIDHGTNCR